MTTTDDPKVANLRSGQPAPDLLRDQAERGIRAMLQLAGYTLEDEGLARTPARVVAAFLEMTAAPGDPGDFLGVTFPTKNADEMVHLGPIEFTSVCEHHLLPFSGVAHLAYLPSGGRVVGVSKLARVVEHYARQLQIQERMTVDIADALEAHLNPRGVGVIIRATHSCMELRGVRKAGASMSTSALRGAIREQPDTRAEFLTLVHSTT